MGGGNAVEEGNGNVKRLPQSQTIEDGERYSTTSFIVMKLVPVSDT